MSAQHLGVDEKPDQPFDLTAIAVGNRHPDTQIALAAVAVQQNIEGPQQQHEQGHLMLLCQCSQLFDQLRGHSELMTGALITWHRGARVIGGQRHDRVLITQLGLPVRQLPRLLTRLQPAALPQGVIAILNGQISQLRGMPALKSVIAADELVD